MKKLITIMIGFGLVAASHAANFSAQSLLNGYNVQVPTNASVVFGATNVLFTEVNGGVVYSATTVMGNTNVIAPTQFQDANSFANANGDLQGNTTIFVEMGNTNGIPIVTTNSLGSYYLNTNVLGLTWYQGSYAADNPWNPNPGIATSNTYPNISANATNIVTFTFVRVPDGRVVENQGNTFSFTATATGTTAYKFSTNVPTIFLQGAAKIRLASIALNSASETNSPGIVVNRVEFCGFQP